jgi:hypothetical protein
MATRHVQDKATTERHARALRELVKRPDNKFCADCKKNGAPHPLFNEVSLLKQPQMHDGLRGICT